MDKLSNTSETPSGITLKVMTWNIEGLRRNLFNLKYFLESYGVDLAFLSEPQTFSVDMKQLMSHIGWTFCAELNSDDKYDQEAPLFHNKSYGGTMVIWKQAIDKYVTVHPTSSTSFLPIIYNHPEAPVSVHIAIYLPTSGHETKFIAELSQLRLLVEELQELHPDCHIYLRGDSNVNPNNRDRAIIFSDFLTNLNLLSVPIPHKTYHHFVGEGLYDSNIDVLLHSKNVEPEHLDTVICKFDNQLVESHHDIILSTVTLPVKVPVKNEDLKVAPKVENNRVKLYWKDDKIQEYQTLLSKKLAALRETWSAPFSKSSLSLLLELTSSVMREAAISSNNHVKLAINKPSKKTILPPHIRHAQSSVHAALKKLKEFGSNNEGNLANIAKQRLTEARNKYKKLSRNFHHAEDLKRDTKLFSILSSNPSSVYRAIKSSKTAFTGQIPYLTVGETNYPSHLVHDGFYDSISRLKTKDQEALEASHSYMSFVEDYQYVLKLCKDKKTIPELSLDDACRILFKMKPHVSDYYSITPLHFINAGVQGLIHFHFLLNHVIRDVNLATVEELNVAYALLLHKGHGKVKTSDSSYRTISTCPFISKALDMYIQELFISKWFLLQAPTQYQGMGSSHELAALLLTEVVQQSKARNLPLFLLFLDARSAFDIVVIEFLVRYLYLSGVKGSALKYLNNRLSHRKTFLEWNKTVMGPIADDHGVEQGGVSSSEFYKLYNNELLATLQASSQGVDMGNQLTISCVGQADDVAIISNNIYQLFNLVLLAQNYCNKLNVKLSTEKTKLMLFADKSYTLTLNPIKINQKPISFTDKAEHVGIIRSISGNLPNIMHRINSSKKATFATLASGLARGHRANPASSIRVLNLYSTPVLLSGLASLVLLPSEINMVHQYHKTTLQRLLKLHADTPQSFIFFMAGSLPATALLHLRQLGLFDMLSRLPQDPLFKHVYHDLLIAKPNSNSWPTRILKICLQYDLPHPLTLMQSPLPKVVFTKLAKSRVTDFWERKLRSDASLLTSLVYFKPSYMSLNKPHPLWWTAGSNPYEVAKAVIQSRMLSGRYRVNKLASHWSASGSIYCPAHCCIQIPETLEHLLLHCPAYEELRSKVVQKISLVKNHSISQLIRTALSATPPCKVQFLLDPSVLPQTILLVQKFGESVLAPLFSFTRTWCYGVHRHRIEIIKQHF